MRDVVIYGHDELFIERHGLPINEDPVCADLEPCRLFDELNRLKDCSLNGGLLALGCKGQKLRWTVLFKVKQDAGEKEREEKPKNT